MVHAQPSFFLPYLFYLGRAEHYKRALGFFLMDGLSYCSGYWCTYGNHFENAVEQLKFSNRPSLQNLKKSDC